MFNKDINLEINLKNLKKLKCVLVFITWVAVILNSSLSDIKNFCEKVVN